MAGASRFLGILSVCGAFRIVIRHARSHVELLQAVRSICGVKSINGLVVYFKGGGGKTISFFRVADFEIAASMHRRRNKKSTMIDNDG